MNGTRVLLVINCESKQAEALASTLVTGLRAAGSTPIVLDEELCALTDTAVAEAEVVLSQEGESPGLIDLVLVLGGDGTMLRAAEIARGIDAPLLGLNLGHVGFLAELEPEAATTVIRAIAERAWHTEERLALDVRITNGGSEEAVTWALNEVSVEKFTRQRMIDVVVEVDNRPLSRWGCDGVVCATPTGSTAYAFSAGGPVVWPEVSAMLVVPLSAHALFARPLVIAPSSVVAFELGSADEAVVWADGRRSWDLTPGSRVEIRASSTPVRFARLVQSPFTDRLVAKFDLPVAGWRGRRS